MNTGAQGESRGAAAPRALRLLLAFVAVSLATRWISLFVPVLDVDESAHIVGSWEMLRGRLLYTEFVNNKPPLLYVYYAIAQACFGRSLIAVHAFTAIVTVPLTALGVSAFFRHSRRGVVAAMAYLVFSAAFIGHDMLASHAEVPMMLAATWALVLLRDEHAARSPLRGLVAGLLFGMAFLCKYQVALWLPGIAAVLAWNAAVRVVRMRLQPEPAGPPPILSVRMRLQPDSEPAGTDSRPAARPSTWMITSLSVVISLAVGFALPLVATWLWFRARGGDAMLIYWTLENNVAYTSNDIVLPEATERFLSFALPFVIVTAPLWWGAWRSWRMFATTPSARGGTASTPPGGAEPPVEAETPYRCWLLLVVLALSVPPAFLGFRFYPHYFIQFYVPLAIGAAPWLEAQLWPRATRAGRAVVAWSLVMLAGFMVATAALYFGPSRVYRERDPVYRLVAARLRADACAAGATLFVWGYAPPFYYYADMPAASRFVVMAQSRLTGYVSGNLARVRDPGEARAGIVPEHWDWLMGDLERNRATFIVDTAPAGIYRWNHYPVSDYPQLREYLAERYDLADTINRVRIFRRRGCEG